MAFEYYSAMYRLETEIAQDLSKSFTQKASSTDIASLLIEKINTAISSATIDRYLIASLRLCIKLHPYSSDLTLLCQLYDKVVRIYAERHMPGLLALLRTCREKSLPLPLIVSCAKYLEGAVELQTNLQQHFFSLMPLIVKGDASLKEEKFENNILTLPVDDTYEGLPLKMMETYAFLSALDDRVGTLKIDDDIKVKPNTTLDYEKTKTLFTAADYMGIAVQSIFHDRLCHHGKCSKPTPFSYGKPIKTAWGRGALYYLSNHALKSLTHYYFRFPGALEGELYEDKAVADMLYEDNIMLAPYPLEFMLSLDTTSPER